MPGSNGNAPAPGAPLRGPSIAYPCEWSYTVIGEDAERIGPAIAAALADCRPQWRRHQTSRTGRYVSFHVVVPVASEAHRDRLFGLLKAIPGVRFVL